MRRSKAEVRTPRFGRRAARLVHDLSLKHKLIAIVMLTCVASLSLAGGIFLAWEWTSLRRAMVRDVTAEARIIAENCQAALIFKDRSDASAVLRTLNVLPSILGACVCREDERLFAVYLREGVEGAYLLRDRERDGATFHRDHLMVRVPVRLDGQRIGTAVLFSDLEPLYARLRHCAAVILGVLLLSSAAAYLISARLQRIISSPILHLAEVARRVSEKKEYTVRAEQTGQGEVGLLIRAFNEMLGQIEQREAALVENNEQLEARVRERTTELMTTNERLTSEVAFRKKVEQALVQRTERIAKYQKAMLRLAKEAPGDLEATMRKATEEVGETLEVERVSVWLLQEDSSELACADLHVRSRHVHETGQRLTAADYPEYFQTMENSRILVANDARGDPRTRCFTDSYLVPLGITSMMDVPIHLRGKLLGIVCHEHVGPMKEWSPEEQEFATSVADLIALQVETCERMKLERVLETTNTRLAETVRDLRRSNKELQEFAYVAAHDLKAPLRGIGTLADWVAADYADRFDEQGRQQMHLLRGRVKRMSGLIDGILHYSEIGRVASSPEWVDLNRLLPEVVTLLDPPAHIHLTIQDNLPTIICEKVRLGQVFRNLIENAIKYMDKPQGRIEIAGEEQEEFWRFAVTDNGPGIEKKYFEKVFQIFQTLTPRDERESTGIGLSIVKKIVELLGGRVWVESKPGEGATFVFTLPKKEIPAAEPPLPMNRANHA